MDRWQYGHYASDFILFLRQKIWARSVQPFNLTFIGYKQTDKQTDRQAKFIYRLALEGASRPSPKLIVNMFSLCTYVLLFSWLNKCDVYIAYRAYDTAGS